MTVKWMDGFALYRDIDDMQPHYVKDNVDVADGIFNVLSTGGPRGNPCLQSLGSTSVSSLHALKLQLPAMTDIIVGMNIMFEGFREGQYYSADTFLRFYNVGGADNNVMVRYRRYIYEETPEGYDYGALEIADGAGAGHYDPEEDFADGSYDSEHAIIEGQWYYLEFRFTFDGTSGVTKVRKDGVLIADLTGDTSEGTNNIDELWLSTGHTSQSSFVGNSGMWRIADFHVIDPTASPNNSFIFPAIVTALKPTAEVGGEIDWVPHSGTNNALMVDDLPHTFDTDVIFANGQTINTKDRYTTTNSVVNSSIAEIIAVAPVAMAKDMENKGAQTMRTVVYEGATEGQGVTNILSAPEYQMVYGIFDTNPDTGLAWTVTETEAAEFGPEII